MFGRAGPRLSKSYEISEENQVLRRSIVQLDLLQSSPILTTFGDLFGDQREALNGWEIVGTQG